MSIVILILVCVMLIMCFEGARQVAYFILPTEMKFFLYCVITVIAAAFMYCFIYIVIH